MSVYFSITGVQEPPPLPPRQRAKIITGVLAIALSLLVGLIVLTSWRAARRRSAVRRAEKKSRRRPLDPWDESARRMGTPAPEDLEQGDSA